MLIVAAVSYTSHRHCSNELRDVLQRKFNQRAKVFLRVFRRIHDFRGQSSLRTWIHQIAINQARNRQRYWRRRHRADQVSFDEHTAHVTERCSDPSLQPDGVLTRKELASRLRRAFEALPFDQRTTIVLREIEGLSYGELAAALGVPRSTVKSGLSRARQALRLRLWPVRPSSKPG